MTFNPANIRRPKTAESQEGSTERNVIRALAQDLIFMNNGEELFLSHKRSKYSINQSLISEVAVHYGNFGNKSSELSNETFTSILNDHLIELSKKGGGVRIVDNVALAIESPSSALKDELLSELLNGKGIFDYRQTKSLSYFFLNPRIVFEAGGQNLFVSGLIVNRSGERVFVESGLSVIDENRRVIFIFRLDSAKNKKAIEELVSGSVIRWNISNHSLLHDTARKIRYLCDVSVYDYFKLFPANYSHIAKNLQEGRKPGKRDLKLSIADFAIKNILPEKLPETVDGYKNFCSLSDEILRGV